MRDDDDGWIADGPGRVRRSEIAVTSVWSEAAMSAEDLENYETEMELQLYREYKDIAAQFSYVVETERRFYLTNDVDLQPRNADGEVYFELTMRDAWVWDMYRPARFVKTVRVRDVQGRQHRGTRQARARAARRQAGLLADVGSTPRRDARRRDHACPVLGRGRDRGRAARRRRRLLGGRPVRRLVRRRVLAGVPAAASDRPGARVRERGGPLRATACTSNRSPP